MVVALRNFDPVDLDRETNGDVLLLVTMRAAQVPNTAEIGAVSDSSRGFVTARLTGGIEWTRYGIPLRCLRDRGADMRALTQPFVLRTTGPTDLAIGEVRLGTDAEVKIACQ